MKPRILIFDSGVGGLSVVKAVRDVLPQAQLFYAADSAGFPYGDWEERRLVKRICKVMARLEEMVQPDLVVVACNTASTLALEALRKASQVPFVGTVPAIKPAALATKSNIVGVLATPGTAKREYTQTLIHTYAFHCRVFMHGATKLAGMTEGKLRGDPVQIDAIRKEIQPVFRRRDGVRTDVVVLGCTHYPLLLEELTAAAPWPVTWIDPAQAIARRVVSVLENDVKALPVADDALAAGTMIFTSNRGADEGFKDAFAAHGFSTPVVISVEV